MDSKIVKQFIKQFDPKCRVDSINGQRNGQKVTHFIRVWGNFEGCKSLRILALRVIYGQEFEINDDAYAGNVRQNYISMHPSEWTKLIEWWNRIQGISLETTP